MQKLLTVDKLRVSLRKKGYSFGRAQTEILHQLSFHIDEGEALGLIGESGSGKSTIAQALTGLIPSTGSIKFSGEALKFSGRKHRSTRKNIQMIFQDPFSSLNPKIRIGKALEEALIIHKIPPKEREARIHKALSELSLPADSLKRYPHEFSGGQKQRINIARALLLKPKLIIADEPVSSLDVSVQAQILHLLKRLQKEHNLAYLFISHDLAVVENLCTRVMILYKGEIVETGPFKEILTNARHPYTQILIKMSHYEEIHEAPPRLAITGEGCRYVSRCAKRARICTKEPAPLKSISAEHQAACHFTEPGDIRATLRDSQEE